MNRTDLHNQLDLAYSDCVSGNGLESLLRLYSMLGELAVIHGKEQAFKAACERHAEQVKNYADATRPTREQWGLGASLPKGDI